MTSTPLTKKDSEPSQAFATGRNRSVDALKGFLIILVILGHAGTAAFFPGLEATWQFHLIGRVISFFDIYYYHMPLFLAVGVFFLRPISLRDLRKMVLTILLPYAIWYVIWSIGKLHGEFFRELPTEFVALLMGNFTFLLTPLWFFPALFSLKVTFAALLKLWNVSSTKQILWAAVLLSAWVIYFLATPAIAYWHVAGYVPFGIDISLYLLPYCVVMLLIYRKCGALPYAILVASGLLVAGHFLIVGFEPMKTISKNWALIDLAQYAMPYTVPGLIGMTALSAGVLILALNLNPASHLIRVLSFIGRYTLAIYVFHLFIMHVMDKIGRKGLAEIHLAQSGYASAALFMMAVICAIAVPIVISKLAMRISPRFSYAGFTA